MSSFPDDNFTVPMVLGYLSDKDALQNLLVCGKQLKPALDNYSIKSSIHALQINDFMSSNKYVKYQIVTVKEIMQIYQLFFLPQSVRKVSFGTDFNQPLEVGVFPPSVTHLTFGTYFNQPLEIEVIPSSVTNLTFRYDFNQPLVAGVIPSSVTYLTFGDGFNQPISIGSIPSSVTHLTFGDRFNQPFEIGSLTSSLQQLVVSMNYNQAFQSSNVIPSTAIFFKCRRDGKLLTLQQTIDFIESFCSQINIY